MKIKLLFILLVSALNACTIVPPDYAYHADLVKQNNGALACETAGPVFYLEEAGDETITVSFTGSFAIVELAPEGAAVSGDAVRWSRKSYDGSATYAFLSRPEKLKVGDIDDYAGESVCVTFNPGLFTDEEAGMEKFSALSGAQCCGRLERVRVEAP